MRVHEFGNRPSPAVSTYGLRHIVRNADDDVKNYVTNDFYVDDALSSTPSAEEAIQILKKTQTVLKENGSIRLHKIASNSPTVLEAFPVNDLKKNLKTLDLCSDDLPVQQSLGLAWDLNTDCLIFNISIPDKPFTKRGELSTVNSLFDPLGFISPIIIHGRILMRDLCQEVNDWDQPLLTEFEKEWSNWKESLKSLHKLAIPRMYTPTSFSQATERSVHILCDASEKAIAAVAYLKTVSESGDVHVGFIMGKSKVVPVCGHTIPRLELCGALLATEVGRIVFEGLNLSPDVAKYYTDSMVVLGYLNNRSRRFYNYVSNRVSTILCHSKSEQWTFVPTHNNPADLGTRCFTTVEELVDSNWLQGPSHLLISNSDEQKRFPLVAPDNDKEIRPTLAVRKAVIEESGLHSKFEKFSSWEKLVIAFALLIRVARARKSQTQTLSVRDIGITKEAKIFILRLAQQASFRMR
ncbi:hypothetical protein FSP39_014942 [Pinctada imbricata]|uniref:Uncharacterized protein n=1 Tax=Pinctada imbricata TaxID=66713 RepID=A0AA89BX62_PINIB|nr:hypothetical protein FSP39_014942 [Pinctada imbricata]